MNSNEIILIDDDDDDRRFFDLAFTELAVLNKVTYFSDAESAFKYLKSITHKPFLIICDINMPGINGLEFKELLNQYNKVHLITIPFVFITTSVSPVTFRFAQNLNIQGYFYKPTSIHELKDILSKILNYWNAHARTNEGITS